MAPTRGRRDAAAQAGGSGGRHAVLHDFCMTIPYGAAAAVSGLGSLAFGAAGTGWQVAGAGAAVLASSVLSLRAWKNGGAAAPFTLLSAGASAWVAYAMWGRVQAGLTPVPCGLLLALSAAAAAFCLYNLAAGGNPPPKAAKAPAS